MRRTDDSVDKETVQWTSQGCMKMKASQTPARKKCRQQLDEDQDGDMRESGLHAESERVCQVIKVWEICDGSLVVYKW